MDAVNDKPSRFATLVKQCLEDLSGKDSSEASSGEWQIAEKEAHRLTKLAQENDNGNV